MQPALARPVALLAGVTHLSLLTGTIGFLLLVLLVTVLVFLIRKPPTFRRHGAPWWQQAALGAASGALVGTAILLAVGRRPIPHSDAPLWIIRISVIVTAIGLGLVVANLRRTPPRRKLAGGAIAVVLVLTAGIGFNANRVTTSQTVTTPAAITTATPTKTPPGTSEITPLPTFSTLSGTVKPTPDLAPAGYAVATSLDRTWNPPSGMPTQGRLESETIPGLVSHFLARPAEVYLPPAALTKNAPALPVLILLSGQPASPLSVVQVGHAVATLNTLAARNHGLAPILVVPDQLGQPQINPMCVNSPLGNAATYIMTDVTTWIRTHLHVLTAPDAWAIGGFSEGGTCSIQFATAHPDVFGTFIDVSGERYPTLATDSEAIREGFAGNSALYAQAMPENIMATHGPYTDMVAVFAVGSTDEHYGAIMPIMSAAAASHGIHVARYISPGTGHDWTTASNGFAAGIGVLYQRFGLAATGQYVAPYSPRP